MDSYIFFGIVLSYPWRILSHKWRPNSLAVAIKKPWDKPRVSQTSFPWDDTVYFYMFLGPPSDGNGGL